MTAGITNGLIILKISKFASTQPDPTLSA